MRHDPVTLNGAALHDKTDALTKELSAVADERYNPNLKARQDSLDFLPKLGFQISGVGGMSDMADAKLTAGARRALGNDNHTKGGDSGGQPA